MSHADQMFAVARDNHEQGRVQQAKALYREIIASHANCAGALNNLGLLEPPDRGVDLFRAAVAAKPDYLTPG